MLNIIHKFEVYRFDLFTVTLNLSLIYLRSSAKYYSYIHCALSLVHKCNNILEKRNNGKRYNRSYNNKLVLTIILNICSIQTELLCKLFNKHEQNYLMRVVNTLIIPHQKRRHFSA